jgi:threonine dehydrogenase-like Zn-dependent dehydrogenase
VVADINAGCGDCPRCQTTRGHHCPTRTVLGILGRDGALAEEVTLPERCLSAVPDAVSDERAVFAEPLAAALHVLDELPEDGSARVVVLGDGKLGLLIALALASADLPVLVVGHHPEKLALAQRFGARTVLESDLDRDAERAPVVVEATGSSGGLTAALALTEPRGTLVLKTTVAGRLDVDLSPVVIDELRLVGSRCGDLHRAVASLGAGLDPTPLVAARYPLARADEALAHAARRGTLKVLVEGTA